MRLTCMAQSAVSWHSCKIWYWRYFELFLLLHQQVSAFTFSVKHLISSTWWTYLYLRPASHCSTHPFSRHQAEVKQEKEWTKPLKTKKHDVTWLLSILGCPLPYSLCATGPLSPAPRLNLGVSLVGTKGVNVSLSPGLCFLVSLVIAGVAGAEDEGGSSSLLLLVFTCRGRKL